MLLPIDPPLDSCGLRMEIVAQPWHTVVELDDILTRLEAVEEKLRNRKAALPVNGCAAPRPPS